MSIAYGFTGVLSRGRAFHEDDFEEGLMGNGLGGEYLGLGRINGSVIVSAEEITEDENGEEVIYESDNVASINFTAIDLSVTGCDILSSKVDSFSTDTLEEIISCVVEPALYYYPIFEKAFDKAMNDYTLIEEITDAVCFISDNRKPYPYIVILENIIVDEDWRESGICTYILENFFKIIKEFCLIEPLMVFGVYEDVNFGLMSAETPEVFEHCLEKTDFYLFDFEDKKCFTKFVYDKDYVTKY